MESTISQKITNDSANAMQAIENGVGILVRMIVKAVVAELSAQEGIFGNAGSGLATIISSKNNIINEQRKGLCMLS